MELLCYTACVHLHQPGASLWSLGYAVGGCVATVQEGWDQLPNLTLPHLASPCLTLLHLAAPHSTPQRTAELRRWD